MRTEVAREFFLAEHGRDDNVILADTDEVWVCDWNWPTRGPIWADTLTVAFSMVGDGLDGDRILSESGLVANSDADLVDGVLALLLGYCLTAGTEAPPDASPSLRTERTWYARVIGDGCGTDAVGSVVEPKPSKLWQRDGGSAAGRSIPGAQNPVASPI